MNNYFAYNLRYLRKQYHLTQDELGRIVGKTKSAISRWELETREPSKKDIEGFCNYFGLEPQDLVYRPLDEQVKNVVLDEQEKELIAYTKLLSKEQMEKLIEIAKGMAQ